MDDATGNSSSVDTVYETEKVANDLPVRVSTQYRTAEKTGSNLNDLAGYNGRVEIELTVENLTVSSQDLTFDVAGESRTAPTLVGAPMSIAASTVLPNVAPSRIVGESGDQATGTNGIVSASPDGETIVQWATLLAPPSSAASTTLRLVADVTDFKTPQIDLAVQPGMATDLSVDGVLDSAFNTSPTSELALQRRTIDLITDVNDVLGRAGATITDVRTNLESTSKSLGVSTAAHLKESTDSLAGTMSGLKDQLGTLKTDLDATVTDAESTTLAQLSQTVDTVDAVLGDTSAAVPTASIKGNGCSAVVAPAGEAATVYSSLVLMSAQLDGYARSTASCRDEVADSLQRTVGPAQPSDKTCKESSLTCAFHASTATVSSALLKLVAQGDKIVDSLNPKIITGALAQHDTLSVGIDELSTELEALATLAATGEANDAKAFDDSLQAVRDALNASDTPLENLESAVKDEKAMISTIHDTATESLKEINGWDNDLENPWIYEPAEHGNSIDEMLEQNAKLASELCGVIEPEDGEGGLTRREVEKLRAYLTATPCPGGEEAKAKLSKKPLDEYLNEHAEDLADQAAERAAQAAKQSKEWEAWAEDQAATWDKRTENQVSAWENVESSTASRDADKAIDAAIGDAKSSLETVGKKLDELKDTVESGASLTGAIDDVRKTVDAAKMSRDSLGKGLEALDQQQRDLESSIKTAFAETQDSTIAEVSDLIDSQIRVVSAQGAEGTDALVKAFDRSVTGLSTTASEVEANAKRTVDGQHEELAKQGAGVSEAIGKQTEASLEGIARSTGASTRDVEGASKLLAASLSKVMLDLGDRTVNGSGLLGSMATSAAKADTADYQLALATQNAQGYANIRSEDVAGILQRQAQFKASMEAATTLPSFHLEVPSGAASQTLYAFRIGGQK